VLNIDDVQVEGLARELSGTALDVWTVSLQGPARLQAQGLGYVDGGLAFDVVEGTQRVAVRSQLVGAFNASNLLVVLGGLRALGVPLADAAAVVARLSPVPGRVQRVTGSGADEQVAVVVDYAHTPDALEKALQALRPLAAARGGRLWCVFGCGGNRDATKRPLMGAIAARDADHVVITSDNPRHENPDAILAQILAGVTGHDEVDVIVDRRQAIHGAVQQAAAGDVVLVAGKGHEDYQDVAGEKRPFSDVTEALAALRARAARAQSAGAAA
jgi:UDP-N-acetylmuramoyl-L-alanyl-D-glutamate--2,6-diaminopimelate ligase